MPTMPDGKLFHLFVILLEKTKSNNKLNYKSDKISEVFHNNIFLAIVFLIT